MHMKTYYRYMSLAALYIGGTASSLGLLQPPKKYKKLHSVLPYKYCGENNGKITYSESGCTKKSLKPLWSGLSFIVYLH